MKVEGKEEIMSYRVKVEKGTFRTSVSGSEWQCFLKQHGLMSVDHVLLRFHPNSDQINASGHRYKDPSVTHRAGNLITYTHQILLLLSCK